MKQDKVLDAARRLMAQKLAIAGIEHHELLQAMATVPRHAFIDPGLSAQAYEDSSLPIGMEQTISKPSVIAKMIQALMQSQKKNGASFRNWDWLRLSSGSFKFISKRRLFD